MVIKEKTQPGISEKVLQRFREVVDEGRRREEEHKQKTPEAPDESGEIGRYDEDASNWLGGHFVYRTDSDRYFTLTGDGYKFVNPIHLESYLMSRRDESRKKQD